jgi:hypothetical protein
VSRFDDARNRLQEAVGSLSAAQLHTPNADGWTVLHVLEHLALLESYIGGELARCMAAPAMERIPLKEHANQFMLDRSLKFKTLPVAAPHGTYADLAEAWVALGDSRRKVDAAMAMARSEDDLHTHGMAFPVEAIGLLSVAQWYDLLAYHELRHVAQIEEMKASWTQPSL